MGGRLSLQFPQYILDVFDHWRYSKERIKIKTEFVPAKIAHMLFHSLSEDTFPDETNPKVNLLILSVLQIFPELELITLAPGDITPPRSDGMPTLMRDSLSFPFSVPL